MTGGGRDFVAGAEASGMMGPGTYITRFHETPEFDETPDYEKT
jgi:hypothetical protein